MKNAIRPLATHRSRTLRNIALLLAVITVLSAPSGATVAAGAA